MIYFELLLVALVTIYIVDLSGFTDSWREWLKRVLKINTLRSLKPFDCSLCMTWWLCLLYALCVGEFSLPVVAYSALLSFLSNPLGQIMIFIREWINWLINKCFPRW